MKPAESERLCIHTITTKPWGIETAIDKYARAGVKGITVWREALQGRDISRTARLIRESGLTIVSLCRGGFFPHPDAKKRKQALEENRTIIREAGALAAPLIVLVCGSHPGQSLETNREQIEEGITSLLPDIEEQGIKLAIEPLHPMYADTRSAVNSMTQANRMAAVIDHPAVGIAVDVYHTWWDQRLEIEIANCGKDGNLFAFHVCDWRTPTRDLLRDRGLMGEGAIPIPTIRGWMEKAGFNEFIEVEIFSKEYWMMEQDKFLEKIVRAYKEHV